MLKGVKGMNLPWCLHALAPRSLPLPVSCAVAALQRESHMTREASGVRVRVKGVTKKLKSKNIAKMAKKVKNGSYLLNGAS